jgi:hypothetical protein
MENQEFDKRLYGFLKAFFFLDKGNIIRYNGQLKQSSRQQEKRGDPIIFCL